MREPTVRSFSDQTDIDALVTNAEDRFWEDAQLAAALVAIDPCGLGGVCVRSAPGPVRDVWTKQFFSLFADKLVQRKLPVSASEDNILGGLDLALTLREGTPVFSKGLLSEVDGGVLVAPMAERMPPATAALVANTIDQGFVAVERSGVSRHDPSRFACLLYDEGLDGSEQPPELLRERVAFQIDLHAVSVRCASTFRYSDEGVRNAKARLADIHISSDMLGSMNNASLSLGVFSLRTLNFCRLAARACAALRGSAEVDENDVEHAVCLVYGPRLSPDFSPPDKAEQPPPEPPQHNDTQDDQPENLADAEAFEQMLVEAARSTALGRVFDPSPPPVRRNASISTSGKSGALVASKYKGRPRGAGKGNPRDGGRLDLIATLRAAAPWRKSRGGSEKDRLPIYLEDIHIKRFTARADSVVIFAVDASGSSAMHRMAEAKGAVELLLSDCYTRRDHVALIAFRGDKAELILPPTRSLLRVRRTLGAMPGGGGTPLAAGIAAAAILAETEKRKGKTPFVVILSDGRGNISMAGEGDREAAGEDAVKAARRLRALGCPVLFFDTSTRPSPRAKALSDEMGGAYRPLPYADSMTVSNDVKQAITAGT